MSYAEWLIPILPLSLVGSCKHTTSTPGLTPVSSAAMVHSYDAAQLYWTTSIIGTQGSRFGLKLSVGHGRTRCLALGHCHHEVSCLPCCLLFLHLHHLHVFASPICCRFPGLGPSTTLFVPIARSISSPVGARPACPILLFCRVALAASVFFAYLLLNAI